MNLLSKALLSVPVCILSFNLQADTAAKDPASLIEGSISNIFTQVIENYEHYKSDPAALQTLVRTDLIPLLDVPYSARLILGRAGRGIPREKVDAFAEAVVNLLIDRYSQGLLHFSESESVKVTVLPQRGALNEKLTRVRTRVSLPKGGEAPIDYAFHKTANGWQAFDVIVEGISYVTTFRNQIMPEVQANGIDSVIARLNAGDLELTD